MKKIVSLLALFLAAPLIAFAQGAPKFTELKAAFCWAYRSAC